MGKRIAVAGGATLLTLALCEIIIRIAGVAPQVGVLDTAVGIVEGESVQLVAHPDPAIGWQLRDGPQQWNRGAARSVAVLGDSIAYGYCAGHEAAFPAVLARLRPDLAITSYAVSGFDARQAVAYFQATRRGLPDVIVWSWCGNDLGRAIPGELQSIDWQSRLWLAPSSWLLRGSALARWVYATHRPRPTDPVTAEPPIAEIAALGTQVLLLPFPYQAPAPSDLSAALAAATAHGLTVVPPDVDPANPEDWCDQVHPSRRGHARVAAQLARLIR